MKTSDRLIVIVLGGILLLLSSAYIYGVGTQLEEMTDRPVRISYFIADLVVLYPLAILTIVGMIRGKGWRYRALWLTLGVLLFDMAHQAVYLFWDNYFDISHAVPVVMFLLIVGFSIYSVRSVREDSLNSNTTNRKIG